MTFMMNAVTRESELSQLKKYSSNSKDRKLINPCTTISKTTKQNSLKKVFKNEVLNLATIKYKSPVEKSL